MPACRDCGKGFKASRTDSTVRCPECRARRREAAERPKNRRGGARLQAVKDSQRFTCKTCGWSGIRRDAFVHRRENPGHHF